MLHDRNKEKLNCDLLTLMSVEGGGEGMRAIKLLLFFVFPYNLLFPNRLYTE